MLLVQANQVVLSDRLIEELWPGQPAEKAADSLQVRLSELRKALRTAGEDGRLATRPAIRSRRRSASIGPWAYGAGPR
jgi:DNA-binding winged helix-turn-helix (wHTH) protein